MSTVLLIDGNALGFASQLGMTRLSNGDQATHAILGFLTTLRKLTLPPTANRLPIVLWDGEASWRKDLLPSYKANRRDDPKKIKVKDEYKSQSPFIRQSLIHLGIDQMLSMSCEADDLAGAYARLLSAKGHDVELITGDQDWLQMVSPKVSWHDPIRDRKVDVMNFEDFTDYPSTKQFLEAKALQGDTSDNIKGVGGIGKVGAKKLLERFGSVEAMLESEEKVPVAWQRLRERPAPFYRNMDLMRLDGRHPSIKERKIIKGRWNREAFENLCNELAFMSISKNLDSWIKPFERKI
jgi:5'-3' exonuclease